MALLQPEKGIRSLLMASSSVQALCGATPTVAPLTAIPRNATMPYIAFQRMNAETMHHLGGVASSGLWMGSTEVTVFAESHDNAVAVAAAMRGVLDGNDNASVTISGDSVTFERLHFAEEDIEAFDPSDASDTRIHTVTQRYEWSARP